MDMLYLSPNRYMTDHRMLLTNIPASVDSGKDQRQCSRVYYLPSYWKNAKKKQKKKKQTNKQKM